MKIGLEIHVGLNTNSKLFCPCAASGDEKPNTRVCPICMGHPGSLPRLNKEAIKKAVMIAKALGCKIAKRTEFARKSYFYPDLSKNYQISQLEPIGKGGRLSDVEIQRVHIEEDPASMVHPEGIKDSSHSFVDYNRSGCPLVEIVTPPEISSPKHARNFMNELVGVLTYLDVWNGVIKADVNVSIKEKGYKRVEVKNVTGFKEIEKVILYEAERQKREDFGIETRGWDGSTTFFLRSKESAQDYGYIIDPDIPSVEIDFDIILPEMAWEKEKRYLKLGVGGDDAKIISMDKGVALLFDDVIKEIDAKTASRWFRNELLKFLHESGDVNNIKSKDMKELLFFIKEEKITDNVARSIIEKFVHGSFTVEKYVVENDLRRDDSEIEKFCGEVIKENEKAVNDYLSGEEKALNFLVGKIMRKTKGKSSPDVIVEIMKKLVC